MTQGQRIAELRKERHMSQRELANSIHVSTSSVGMWETDQRTIKDRDLMALSNLFNVSADYILGKSDEPLSLTNWDNPNLAIPSSKTQTDSISRMHRTIPAYGIISAGMPIFADEHIIGETYIPDSMIREYGIENLFALKVKGDSMSKVIAPGFIAVFAKDIQIENGNIVAVLIDGDEATLKRYHETSRAYTFEPDSFNPLYKPIIFPKSEEPDFRILGKYIFASNLLE